MSAWRKTYKCTANSSLFAYKNVFSGADTPRSGVSALLVPTRCTLIFASQCPTPLCGVEHWGGGEKLGVKGQERFKNRLPYSAGTASAYLNYPQRPFHLRASPALPATPVIFSVRPVREVNFVCFAMLKNVVGFVVIRQNALSPLPAPRSGAGGGGNVQNRRFFCRYLLTKYLFRRGYAAARRIHVIFRDALSHLKAMPATAQRRIHTKRVGLKNM